MKNIQLISALLFTFFIFNSCNKEKRYSQKLMKGENWNVKHIKINGETSNYTGNWYVISDIDIYESIPTIEWKQDGMDAIFEWQFQNNGETFQFSYNQLCSEANGILLDTLDYISHNISGSYNVERHGRNKMEFHCSSTIGYPNQMVEIFIERVK